MTVQWFGGPMAGTQLGTQGYQDRQRAIQGIIGGAFSPSPQTPQIGGGYRATTPATRTTTSIASGAAARDRLGVLFAGNRSSTPSTPTTPGTAPGAPGGRNPNEDLLNRQIRRLAGMRQAADTQVVQEGASRGLWRSTAPQLEENRDRQTEASQDAWQRFMAGEFESQRQTAADERRLQLERERMQQQMELERQRADWERQLQEQRLAAGAQQGAADRQNSILGSLLGGGGGGGSTRLLSSTTRNRAAAEQGAAQAPQQIQGSPQQAAAQQQGGGMTGSNMYWDPYRGWVSAAGAGSGLPPLGQAIGDLPGL